MSTIRVSLEGDQLLSPADLIKTTRMALNRVITASKGVVANKTIETYRLGRNTARKYIKTRKATATAYGLEGAILLGIDEVPIEAFKPRVVTRLTTVTWRGRQITRRIATIELQRFVKRPPKLVGPAFPLRQRRSGLLRRGELVRRRIGKERRELSYLRYHTFPRRFVREELEPALQAFAPARFAVEFQSALRFNRSGGRRVRP